MNYSYYQGVEVASKLKTYGMVAVVAVMGFAATAAFVGPIKNSAVIANNSGQNITTISYPLATVRPLVTVDPANSAEESKNKLSVATNDSKPDEGSNAPEPEPQTSKPPKPLQAASTVPEKHESATRAATAKLNPQTSNLKLTNNNNGKKNNADKSKNNNKSNGSNKSRR